MKSFFFGLLVLSSFSQSFAGELSEFERGYNLGALSCVAQEEIYLCDGSYSGPKENKCDHQFFSVSSTGRTAAEALKKISSDVLSYRKECGVPVTCQKL